MKNILLHRSGYSDAVKWACHFLSEQGIPFTDRPSPQVTHLLLPVPSFEPDGSIKGGGILEHILPDLSPQVTVIGGNLRHPGLAKLQRLDLLQDGQYTAENAAITADCAIRVAGQHLPSVFAHCPVVILGWGRIGKCLAFRLRAMGADVTIAARKENDRHIIKALGFHPADPAALSRELAECRVLFNTVPAPILDVRLCRADCIKIELASRPGLYGGETVSALALPGKIAPESSGKLIAQTVIRLLRKEESV